MTRPVYALDTQTLYWYETADPQLSPKAGAIFTEAEQGRAELVLSPIVLAEFAYILRKLGLEGDFPAYVTFIEANPVYRLEPITWDDLRQLPQYPEIPEMHDRLITIQAARLGAVLVTRDRTIQGSPRVRWTW